MAKAEKTNVERKLDQIKIEYSSYHYDNSHAMSGVEVANSLGKDEKQVFKTLVTVGKSNEHYVFVIPVACELDLKKASQCVGEKSVEMVHSKDLLGLTGYIHGGCSPIGMKKFFKTTIDKSAENLPTMLFSGGKIGCQVEMSPLSLSKVIKFSYCNLIKE